MGAGGLSPPPLTLTTATTTTTIRTTTTTITTTTTSTANTATTMIYDLLLIKSRLLNYLDVYFIINSAKGGFFTPFVYLFIRLLARSRINY